MSPPYRLAHPAVDPVTDTATDVQLAVVAGVGKLLEPHVVPLHAAATAAGSITKTSAIAT